MSHGPLFQSTDGRVFTRQHQADLPLASKGGRLGRSVIQDLLNLLHNLRRQLGDELQCLHVVLDLLDLHCIVSR